ncbi:MAG: DUF3987 domain-containing protein [Phycisphaeraceae bacterium]|nr:DUF3987 domain-containing protein [Phycisphaeraceae bacterium]
MARLKAPEPQYNNGHAPPPVAVATQHAAPALPASYEPFPTDALPVALAQFVREGSDAIGCDPAFVALPLLAALASAVGNTRSVALKSSWHEPAIIWAAVVAESGSAKSPAQELALRPVRERQHAAMQEHAEALELHEAAMAEWKAASGSRSSKATPTPIPPVCRRFVTADITTEKLAHLLAENPRGLLLARDELGGWFGSFDRYNVGRGDAAAWLEVFGGRALLVDRRGTGTTYAPRASVSVCGTIQPGALRRALTTAHVENGLAARVLFAMPPRTPRRWTEADVCAATEASVSRVFARLYELEPDADDAPRLVGLSPEAKRLFVRFVDAHGLVQAERIGAEAAALAKLEAYGARLALVLHLASWAAGSGVDLDTIEPEALAAGVTLARWFGSEAERIYTMLDADGGDDARLALVDLIQRKGGTVTARDIARASRALASPGAAEAALDDLARAGAGHWVYPDPHKHGGRPSRVFVLTERRRCQNPPPEHGNDGFVDCRRVDGGES